MEKDSRHKLIEAATPLFANKGYESVSIREVAITAGVNSALISYYFGGKEGLYIAVLEDSFIGIFETIAVIQKLPLGPQERIEQFAKAVSAAHKQKPYLLRLIQRELLNPTTCFDSTIKNFFTRMTTFLPGAIMEGCSTGQFKPDTQPLYAGIALAGMVNFYFIVRPILERILPTGVDHDAQYINQALSIYFQGLGRDEHA